MRKVIFMYARLQIHQAWNILKILKPYLYLLGSANYSIKIIQLSM